MVLAVKLSGLAWVSIKSEAFATLSNVGAGLSEDTVPSNGVFGCCEVVAKWKNYVGGRSDWKFLLQRWRVILADCLETGGELWAVDPSGDPSGTGTYRTP